MARPIDEIIQKHGAGIRHGDLYITEPRTKTLRLLTEEEKEILPRLLSSQRVLVRPGSNEFWRLVQQGWKIRNPNPYIGFRRLVKQLEQRGDVDDPHALAAWIGRRKYGTERFQQMAMQERRNPHAWDGDLVVGVRVKSGFPGTGPVFKYLDLSGFSLGNAKQAAYLYITSKIPRLLGYEILVHGRPVFSRMEENVSRKQVMEDVAHAMSLAKKALSGEKA